jgi:hypothetical protein
MDKDFDRFLDAALAPPERLPDRRFVAGVQTRIALDDRLARERAALIGALVKQLAALLAVAADLWMLGRAAPVASFGAQSPAVALLVLLGVFGCAVALFAQPGSGSVARA